MRSINLINFATFVSATALLAAAPISHAATATTLMDVTATVLSSCVAVATPVIFGNYTGAAVDSHGHITVTCTPDVSAYNVGLGSGAGSGATTSARKMTNLLSADTLGYHLFRDAARTQNWGEIAADWQPSSAATSTAGTIKTFTVYGRLTAEQQAGIGAYADIITVTVNY